MPRELTLLEEKILCTERKISNMVQNLPDVASAALLRGLVLDEVVSTNAIEDIRSTRQQVLRAIDAEKNSNKEDRRFRELACMYMQLVYEQPSPLCTPADIRTIYDEVTKGEISSDKSPEGKLFRAQGVDIIQSSGSRVIHSGLEPESAIIGALQQMIDISCSPDIPAIFSALAAHYIFEFIHPFYDGNGRTGRYLLSLMLSETLSTATTLSVSRSISENRSAYYKAFESVEKPLNHGELTHFVCFMLKVIREAQIQLEEKLDYSACAVSKLNKSLQTISMNRHLKGHEMQIIYMLALFEVFGLFGVASVQELAGYLKLKDQMTRKHLSSLEDKGIVVKQHKRKPLTFALSKEFKESLNL